MSVLPPENLYHYTDQQGMFGILETGELWATRIHCLNDHQEFRHGLEILKSAILALPYKISLQTAIDTAFDSVSKINICVSSWTEHRDQLSQWRAYGGQRQGYALGLQSSDLLSLSQASSWTFKRCIYDEHEKLRFSDTIAAQFRDKLASVSHIVGDDPKPNGLNELLRDFVFPFVPFFKHSGFREEAEWRLVSPPIGRSDPLFHARPGPLFPLTFYKLRISGGTGKRLSAKIVIGPGASQELASHGIAVAAARSQFDVHSRVYSQTPWRTG